MESIERFLAKFWQSVSRLTQSQCRAYLECIAKDYVRPDMATRFLRDLGSRKCVQARYFRHAREISRRDDIKSLWKTEAVQHVDAWIVCGDYHEPTGFHVAGIPQDFSTLFIEEEGDAVSCIQLEGVVFSLFFTQMGELFVLEN